jgi:hypothetical protein
LSGETESLQLARKGIRPSESRSRDMGNLKIKVGEVKKPTGLMMIQMLGTTEVGEVLVICKNLDRKRGTVKVLTPDFEGPNDCKEFPIIDVIVAFGGDEGLREIRIWVPITVGVSLEKDCLSSITRGIGGNGKWGREIGKTEDWFGQEGLLEVVKR